MSNDSQQKKISDQRGSDQRGSDQRGHPKRLIPLRRMRIWPPAAAALEKLPRTVVYVKALRAALMLIARFWPGDSAAASIDF